MKVLVACELSGVVRDAFLVRGHDAISCDLLPTERPGPHYQETLFNVLDKKWDLMIAHPPCTRLCNSGVRWLEERNLWNDLLKAGNFFKKLLTVKHIPKICVENPIPHKYAVNLIGRKYDQIIQPWQFGHGETKATCLWLKNLPKLQPTNIVSGREQRIFNMPKNADRGRLRSITFQGIADAMAAQWG